jgi:hypothetical protein
LNRPFLVAPPPFLRGIRPPALCKQTDLQEITLEGSNFLIVYDTVNYNAPSVLINGNALDQANLNFFNCTTILFPGYNVEICSTITASIDTSPLSSQRNTLTVINPAIAQCQGMTSSEFLVLPPPVINGISPALICVSNNSETITIQGTGLVLSHSLTPSFPHSLILSFSHTLSLSFSSSIFEIIY